MDALLPPPLLSPSTSEASPLAVGVPTLLLFSSSWCPDCKPFLSRLLTMLEDVNDGRLLLNVVYISSDRSEDQYASYLSKLAGAEGVLAVPFSSTELRADLKRRFKTCAGSEQAELGIEGGDDHAHGAGDH